MLDGDDVDEEPEVPPMVDEEPEVPPDVDESEPELLPVPEVPELPRPEDDDEDPGKVDDDDDPGRVEVVPGIELDEPGMVLELDEPGMLELPDDEPVPVVPEAPDDPDMPLPEDPDMPLLEDPDMPLLDVLEGVSLLDEPLPVVAPADGLAEVPPNAELPPAPEVEPVDCAMATPADRDRRTAIVVSFFIFHSSICLTTFHHRAWTLKVVENCQSDGDLTRFDSVRHARATYFMGAK